jgi:hypothetical protein
MRQGQKADDVFASLSPEQLERLREVWNRWIVYCQDLLTTFLQIVETMMLWHTFYGDIEGKKKQSGLDPLHNAPNQKNWGDEDVQFSLKHNTTFADYCRGVYFLSPRFVGVATHETPASTRHEEDVI